MTNTILEPGHVTEIPISKLRADPGQPRKTFNQDGLEALATSIKTGVHVPLLVRPATKKGNYIIHDGERRYRAASLAKLKTLPVLLVETGTAEQDIQVAQLTVNNQREQLKPMEIARVLAGMRKNDFATLNDLAAFLEKSGLPAMKKQQISDAIALMDLPQWAQDMVDAGHTEATTIRKLKVALPYKNVLDIIEKQAKSDIEWRGRLTDREVVNNVSNALSNCSVELDAVNTWNINPVHFDAKTACNGCEHLIKFDGHMHCMDEKAFEKKNAEAKAAGLGPGGSKPEKAANQADAQDQDEKDKKEARSRTLGQKAQAYLHTYLVGRIVAHMLETKPAINITLILLTWHAMKRPGEIGWSDKPSDFEERQPAKDRGIGSIENILANKAPALKCDMLHAAAQVASEMHWRETQVICHHLWGQAIEDVWQMDEAFLNLFRKVELLHLVELHDMESEYGGINGWGKLKVTEIKSAILVRADKVRSPQVLQDIYADVDEPYKPHDWRSGNE